MGAFKNYLLYRLLFELVFGRLYFLPEFLNKLLVFK